MSALASIALASGVLCALAPLAQGARILVTGSARDVSLVWLALYALGSAVWISYGATIASLPLIISQSIALASVTVVLLLALSHRRNDHDGPSRDQPIDDRVGEHATAAPHTQPFTTPRGTRRATGEARPTRSTTETTRSTSL